MARTRYLHRLASFSRLILFDMRGVGLSDRGSEPPTLEVQMDDVRTVMDTAGSGSAAIFGGAGEDHIPFLGDLDAIVDEIEEFLTGVRPAPERERMLATVLFTDIVDSIKRAAELGDRRWHDLLDHHHRLVCTQLDRCRGEEIETAGDGFLASFDGPARAILCALEICAGVHGLGMEVRAGLHTGEVELMGDGIGGIAVHIGARVAAFAHPGEVLVSRTVADLVAGSGIAFEERGEYELKGVPGAWELFAVEGLTTFGARHVRS